MSPYLKLLRTLRPQLRIKKGLYGATENAVPWVTTWQWSRQSD